MELFSLQRWTTGLAQYSNKLEMFTKQPNKHNSLPLGQYCCSSLYTLDLPFKDFINFFKQPVIVNYERLNTYINVINYIKK